MRYVSIIIFLFLSTAPVLFTGKASAQGIEGAIAASCNDLDEEDQYYCLIDLAVKNKSIAFCSFLSTWPGISECIDEVLKVSDIPIADCDKIKHQYFSKQYIEGCREKLNERKAAK